MYLFLLLFFISTFCTAHQQDTTPLLFVLQGSDIIVYSCDQLNYKDLCMHDEMKLLAHISLSERGLSVQKLIPLRLSSSVAILHTKRGAYEKFFNVDWWRILGQNDTNRKDLYIPKTHVRILKRITSLIVSKNCYTDDVYVIETPQEIKSAFIICVPTYVVAKIKKVIIFAKNELIALGLLTPAQSPELNTTLLPGSTLDFVDEAMPQEQEFSIIDYMYTRLEVLRRKIQSLLVSLW